MLYIENTVSITICDVSCVKYADDNNAELCDMFTLRKYEF